MPSLDFELEKNNFRDDYNDNRSRFDDCKSSMMALLDSVFAANPEILISKIEGRVKEREECVQKFIRKYRTDLEEAKSPYCIMDTITDIVGLRIVCLYEDEVDRVRGVIDGIFDVIEVTDKISEMERTEALFGYKGLHVDARLKPERLKLDEYSRYGDIRFEIQLRTLVQDAWSVIDHKIKYKKSIPNSLKRRVNTLAALFELADREFRAIRDETLEKATDASASYPEIDKETKKGSAKSGQNYHILDAFSFLRIANHFFSDFHFEDHKVDGFVEEIHEMYPGLSRGKLNFFLKSHIATVKKYAEHLESEHAIRMNPFTIIRHCLYMGDEKRFLRMLGPNSRANFRSFVEGD